MVNFKLGKKAPKFDPRTLQFKKYVRRAALPPLYPNQRWGQSIRDWGMMKNDSVGDCTCATVGHMVMQWTSDALGTPKVISDNDILKAYTAVTAEENNGQGYNPVTGANDNGCAILDVLKYWQATGVGGDKCGAFVQMEAGNVQHIQEAIHLFGSCYIGVNLPLDAQDQVNAGQGWFVKSTTGNGEPGSWGGHAIPLVGYDKDGFTCVTWGALQHMTYNWFKIYCDEAYAVLSQDWFNGNRPAPSGFDLETLQTDLNLIGSQPASVHRDVWDQFLHWLHLTAPRYAK